MATNNSWNNEVAAANSNITLNCGTNTISVGTDAGSKTINIGFGSSSGNVSMNIGSQNGNSGILINGAGTGAIDIQAAGSGTVTMFSGTGAVNIGSNNTVSAINLGAAPGGSAVKTVTVGCTNSTSSTFIQSGTGNVSINSGLTVDSTGRMKNTVQPAFLAYVSSTLSNVTGDGTNYTIIFGSSSFDQNSNYNTGTGTFTAPVTGKYLFGTNFLLTGIGIQTTTVIQIVTTASTFEGGYIKPTNGFSGLMGISYSTLAPMSAGDTCVIKIAVGGSTKTVGVLGDASVRYSTFSGYLVC